MTSQHAALGPMWRLASKAVKIRRSRALRSPVCLGCHVFQGRGVRWWGPGLHRHGEGSILVVHPPIRYPDDEGTGSLRIDVLTQFPG